MRKKSYPRKLFFAYSSVLLSILFVIFFVAISYIYKEQYTKNTETQSQIVIKTQEQIDFSLQSMDRIIHGLLADRDFMNMMTATPAPDRETLAAYDQRFETSVKALDAPLFATYRVLAFNENGWLSRAAVEEDAARVESKLLHYPWRSHIQLARGDRVTLSPHGDIFSRTNHRIYSVARAVMQDERVCGIVEVQNNFSTLEDYCDIHSPLGSIAVFAPNGNIVFPLDERVSKNFLHNIFKVVERQTALAGDFSFHFAQPDSLVVNGPIESESLFGGYNAQLSYAKSKYSGWVTVMYNPRNAMFAFAPQLLALAVLVFLSAAVLSLGMMLLLTRRMTAPLVDLNQAVSSVSLEDLALVLPQSYQIVEIENINRSFQTMFDNLREAIAKSIQARAGEERANYLALEAQMNPHTLYNTISMIESVSYMNGDKEVSALCVSFSQMLRYLSDYSKRQYTVGDEMEYLACYSALIKKRYEGALEINVHADKTLLSYALPKYTVQPLVENAVKYAMCEACHCLVIDVTVERIQNGWHILVCDNGRGFAQERLTEIYAQFARCDESLQKNSDIVNMKIGNMGLSNLYLRCRILYGHDFYITVSNRGQSVGGCVELAILQENQSRKGVPL
ncbi:MAG: histidine kinase [Ruthenibacterium sp.]